jgi:hypothetical protein
VLLCNILAATALPQSAQECDTSHFVVVDEIGEGPLRPAPGRLVEFVREDAHGSWDFDALGTEKGELILPIKAT